MSPHRGINASHHMREDTLIKAGKVKPMETASRPVGGEGLEREGRTAHVGFLLGSKAILGHNNGGHRPLHTSMGDQQAAVLICEACMKIAESFPNCLTPSASAGLVRNASKTCPGVYVSVRNQNLLVSCWCRWLGLCPRAQESQLQAGMECKPLDPRAVSLHDACSGEE